jgi:hypothetical protein
MDNAANAVNKLFAKSQAADQADSYNATGRNNSSKSTTNSGDLDETVDQKVAPAVEHKHVKKEHETREQTFVNKDKHQDHYHTTVQPVKQTAVLPEKHDNTQETKNRNINHDDGAAKAKSEADRARFENTSEQKQFESKTKEQREGEEHVHHHLHETVQPVIEKGELNTEKRDRS